jgi:NAD(P)-dependent dehydrogenase (short-subunit alcohol dehydrogenase family)
MPTALITGASRGLGHATAHALAHRGWDVIVDARDGVALQQVVDEWGRLDGEVTVIPGDVASPEHRSELATAVVAGGGRLDLLLNNASTLGPSPLPPLAELPTHALAELFDVNVVAPLALVQLLLPYLRAAGGAVIDVSSDAAVEPYAGWGGYGASKAALDQLTAVLGIEVPALDVYAFDPGDMRTTMHQAAFPDEDISDRPEPETVVPALVHLVEQRPASGRYRASELLAGGEVLV